LAIRKRFPDVRSRFHGWEGEHITVECRERDVAVSTRVEGESDGRIPDMMKLAEGARYEISVDGTVRAHRDEREIALEAANVLKACHPDSNVVVRDLSTGETLEFGASDAMARKHS